MTKNELTVVGFVCMIFGWAFLYAEAPYISLAFCIVSGICLVASWFKDDDHNDPDDDQWRLQEA